MKWERSLVLDITVVPICASVSVRKGSHDVLQFTSKGNAGSKGPPSVINRVSLLHQLCKGDETLLQ